MPADHDQENKVRENRLRRAAERQGLVLRKHRARDVNALGYGTYMLVDPNTNAIVFHDWNLPGGFGLDLDDVEQYLTTPRAQR